MAAVAVAVAVAVDQEPVAAGLGAGLSEVAAGALVSALAVLLSPPAGCVAGLVSLFPLDAAPLSPPS